MEACAFKASTIPHKSTAFSLQVLADSDLLCDGSCCLLHQQPEPGVWFSSFWFARHSVPFVSVSFRLLPSMSFSTLLLTIATRLIHGDPGNRGLVPSPLPSSVNQAASASVPVMPDAHGSPKHPGPSIQGSFHISQTAPSFHGFGQGATNPCCFGHFQ